MIRELRIENLEFRIYSFIALFLILIALFYAPSAYAQQATLSLSPASGTFNRNCAFSLDVNLNTGGADTDGTDSILVYDPSRFSATSITNGTVYSEYPGNNIDSTNGKITISGLASVTSPFTGSGKLATVNFLVKDTAATGATQMTFDFDANNKSKTTDSNIVQRGTVVDILNSVVNGSFTVGSGSCAAASPAPGSARGAPSGVATPSGAVSQPTLPPAPKTLDQAVGDKTANEQLTFTVAIVGTVMVVLGVLGLALL